MLMFNSNDLCKFLFFQDHQKELIRAIDEQDQLVVKILGKNSISSKPRNQIRIDNFVKDSELSESKCSEASSSTSNSNILGYMHFFSHLYFLLVSESQKTEETGDVCKENKIDNASSEKNVSNAINSTLSDGNLANKLNGLDNELKSPTKDPSKLHPFSNSQFKYAESIRKKEERGKLRGFDCTECQNYYSALDLSPQALKKRMKYCSRHKSRYSPVKVPDSFWSAGPIQNSPQKITISKTCSKLNFDAKNIRRKYKINLNPKGK